MKKGDGFPRQCEHWLGMTTLRGVRGDAPQGYLLRCVGIASTDVHRRPFRMGSICRLLIAVFGKQGGGFLAVYLSVLADVLNGGLIQLALDPGG